MPKTYASIHVLGSRQYGGADQFYVRLLRALRDAGQPVTAVNRAISPVAAALAEDEGIEQIHLPLANSWDAWTVWRLRKLVEERQPCIVQTYMGRATRLTRLAPKTQAVHIARLGGYYKIDGYYRHAHAWIGNTQGLCDYLVKNGLPAERVFHISNFVPEPVPASPAQLEALRQEWAIPADAWVLFTLGRLIDIKGFDDLLEAFKRLPREIDGRPLFLLIAGTGPLEAELKSLCADLGLDSRVRWLGWQDPPDAFYELADGFVCPSRKEALGNVILEAWNHGLPVVSTETPGALELIDAGVSGLLSPLLDPKALAGRLREMFAATAEQRAAMGAAGQAYLNAHFGKAAILDAYVSMYERLLAKRGA
jgi:glycosyltransferase involved in cell wall biosynthesis